MWLQVVLIVECNMIIVQIKPKVRYFMCECELEGCPQCHPRKLNMNDLYEVLKNPKPALIGEVTETYEY